MNNKGLFLALSACLIFVVGLSLIQLTLNNETNDFSSELLKAKAKISNYEIVMGEILQGCDWENNILNCADSNSDLLLFEMNSSGNLSCSTEAFSFNASAIRTEINCVEEILSEEKIFALDINKEVIIEKIGA